MSKELSSSSGLTPETGTGPSTAFGLDDTYITNAMQAWDVPGLSIAIVKDGVTVFSKGYGVLTAGRKARVNRDTLFTIGSCTKAFTTVAVGLLVAEGKCSWDDPVIKFLPDFALADPEVTRALTLKDIVTHSSGVEDGAITNIKARTTRSAIKRLRDIKPIRAHRGGFSYNNTLFAVLGKVVEIVSGQDWEAFVTSRILDPLGMNHTYATIKASADLPNRARPHQKLQGKKKSTVMDVKNLDFLASSAGLQSNITDLAAWLKFQIDAGQSASPMLSQAALDEMHSEQIEVVPNPFTLMMHPGSTRHGFGMAWFVRDYAGARIVQHGGYVDGFTSFAVMGPAQRFGVVVLTNMHNSLLPFALAYRVIDAYLNQPTVDWSGYFLQKRADHRNKVSPHDEENAKQDKANRKQDKQLKAARKKAGK
ncbi:MAG: beta-lactamase family protein [Cyanobacteria bacterium SZAS LIN-3]|nr:beta-lactamase family protein [Cyanobacteria bacterium SZAS LIN-3]